MKTSSFFGFSLSILLSAVGCTASSNPAGDASEDGEAVEQTEDALRSCGKAKYDEAFAHYKNAVEWSKDRERRGVCESDHGYLWTIADEASKTVMTCGDFREVIKTSKWAAPVRRVLAPSLTLKSLTGELKVIKESRWQNWSGVDAFVPGTSFWARAEGAYGSAVRVDFRANGQATWGFLHYDEPTGEISWRTEAATYSIAKPSGEAGKRTVTVVHGGKTEKLELGVEDGWEYKSAPVFVLVPSGAATKSPKLESLVSECDA